MGIPQPFLVAAPNPTGTSVKPPRPQPPISTTFANPLSRKSRRSLSGSHGTGIAQCYSVRLRLYLSTLVFLMLVCAWKPATADEVREQAPLGLAEARIGQGMALGGGAGESTWRLSPLNISALASYAINADPWVSVYGGLVFEGRNRAAIGGLLGLRLNPGAGRNRLSVAAVAMGLPFSAYGATVGLGRCIGVEGGMGFCTDLEATVFGLGSDIPEGRIATQVQAVLGVAFDVF